MQSTSLGVKLNFNDSKKVPIDWKKVSIWLPFTLLSLIMVIIPLIMVFVITLIPVEGMSVNDNWSILNGTIWQKIGKSIYISLISTTICVLISFPFCYFLSQTKSKIMRRLVFLMVSMPMWLGSMVILISLKMTLDKINGALNSTYGDIFTIIGIVYLYIPYMMIPIYNTLEQLPQNLINASRDLGRNQVYTFFKIVVPFTKHALISGISLVLLPSISVVAVPQFLNNSPDGQLIGDIIMGQGIQASESAIALSRACVLSIAVSVIMFAIYGLVIASPRIWNKLMVYKTKKEMNNEK
ncbi:MAG: ABC transporter permease [Mycoplasma sp.]